MNSDFANLRCKLCLILRLLLIFGLSLLATRQGFSESMPSPFVSLRSYSEICKQQALEKIGWEVQTLSEGEPGIFGDFPRCTQLAKGNLKLQLPAEGNPSRESLLDEALLSGGTSCAFQNQYKKAVTVATRKLQKNHLYWFTPFWTQDNIKLWSLKKEWQEIPCSGGNCFVPQALVPALDALKTSFYSTDCAAGLQIATYVAAQELFGSEALSQIVSLSEIVIGDWPVVQNSNSLTFGLRARKIQPRAGLAYGRSGPYSFAGVPGYLGAVYGESFLDNKTNQGENFLITEVSSAGAESFLNNGGLPYYKGYLSKFWESTQGLQPEELQALQSLAEMNRLKGATDLQVQRQIRESANVIVSNRAMQAAALLNDPFLIDTQIYVHPVGVQSIAWHLLRLAQLNSRTPYELFFYADTAHAEIFDRWLTLQLRNCEPNGLSSSPDKINSGAQSHHSF